MRCHAANNRRVEQKIPMRHSHGALCGQGSTALLLAASLFTGCGEYSSADLVAFFDKNLTTSRIAGGMETTIKMRTAEYAIAIGSLNPGQGYLQSKENPDEEEDFYRLIVSSRAVVTDGVHSMEDPFNWLLSRGRKAYSDSLNSFRYGRMHSAKIVLANGDTLAPVTCYLDRSQGGRPYTSFTYFFRASDGSKRIELRNAKAVVKDLIWYPGEIVMKIPFVPRLSRK